MTPFNCSNHIRSPLGAGSKCNNPRDLGTKHVHAVWISSGLEPQVVGGLQVPKGIQDARVRIGSHSADQPLSCDSTVPSPPFLLYKEGQISPLENKQIALSE